MSVSSTKFCTEYHIQTKYYESDCKYLVDIWEWVLAKFFFIEYIYGKLFALHDSHSLGGRACCPCSRRPSPHPRCWALQTQWTISCDLNIEQTQSSCSVISVYYYSLPRIALQYLTKVYIYARRLFTLGSYLFVDINETYMRTFYYMSFLAMQFFL
jgi:hypothetical protein